ncbi:MAG: hypothetical protein J5J06_16885 [Phycisphaerae bacterium]|nr:hypothetical protein [Phycisphaerae bacterium]
MSRSHRVSVFATPPARRKGRRCALTLAAVALLAVESFAQTPFAVEVISYDPAPGQFVNDPELNDPSLALGPPEGGGTFAPAFSSLVTLGGFGGSITLRFDHVVQDHPLNPFGMDAIVFGNAHYVSDNGERRWAECATIEIALDADGSGLIEADRGERWYLIPGSHLHVPDDQRAEKTWDDNPATPLPPTLLSWIPPGQTGAWETSGFLLPADIFAMPVVENPSPDPAVEGIWGYAEYTPTLLLGDLDGDNNVDDTSMTPDEFYTVPDDPGRAGLSPRCGGGDAFDIAWAVDPETGVSANIGGFDFIRLTNAADIVIEVIGEKSPEIDAVSDVAPDRFGDCDGDLDIDLADAACFQRCLNHAGPMNAECPFLDDDNDDIVTLVDWSAFVRRLGGQR